MKLKEDTQLAEITKLFSDAAEKFAKRDYKTAAAGFEKIIEDYKDSEFYSVLELQTRAKSYKNICDSKTEKKKSDPETEDDILNELLFNINVNDFKEAEKMIKKLEAAKITSAYSLYLRSVLAYKQGDITASLGLLKKTVAKDERYKIIANNDPDLQALHDNGEFSAIIE